MAISEDTVVRWLFDGEQVPSSQMQVEELARGLFDRTLTATPRTWHPSLGAAIDQLRGYDPPETFPLADDHEAVIIEGPWAR